MIANGCTAGVPTLAYALPKIANLSERCQSWKAVASRGWYLPRKADDDCLQELRWIYDRCDLKEAHADLAAWLKRRGCRYPS